MGLTACLIIHNEAHVLERCLNSVAPLVDELCVLDSGSEDSGVDIARRFGARVRIDRSLADQRGRLRDFAAARNAVLSMARSRWVLSIDADEVLAVQAPSSLHALLTHPRLHAIEVRIVSGRQRWYLPRLFTKMPWTRWHERVHEWVEIRGRVRRTDCVTIVNLPDKTGKESAAARDKRLCARQLRENPDNLRAVFYMARALRHLRRYRAAIPYYLRYSREADFVAGRYTADVGAAVCYLLLQEFECARRLALRAYRRDSQLAEACCVLGDASVGLGRLDLARAWFERARAKRLPDRDVPLFVDSSNYDEYPRMRLQWIAERRS